MGFSIDSNGSSFGFADQNGTFTSVSDPNRSTSRPTVTQLLGINNNNIAAVFYADPNGDAEAFLYSIATQSFTAIILPASFNACRQRLMALTITATFPDFTRTQMGHPRLPFMTDHVHQL